MCRARDRHLRLRRHTPVAAPPLARSRSIRDSIRDSIRLLGVLLALALAAPASGLVFGKAYPVTAFEIEYALEHPDHIPVEDLLDLEVGLRSTPEAYVAPRPVDRTVRMRLRSLPRNASFSATALQHINQHIVSTFTRAGIDGVVVTVPEIEERGGTDLRRPGKTSLILRIWTGRVARVTSVADGSRFGGLETDARTNLAAHEWIRDRSPVRPGGIRGLLRVRTLEDYASVVSRHPGRHVEIELAPGPSAGTTDVNLRVAEAKPWFAYAQYSNTGTAATTPNRQRFGFEHDQLLGRDDILKIDYVTGDFESPHAIAARYDSPFVPGLPWRFRLHGSWAKYDASEVALQERFSGQDAVGGVEIVHQLYQNGDFFLDGVIGGRAHHVKVNPLTVANDPDPFPPTSATYMLPRVSLEGSRRTMTSNIGFDVGLEAGFPDRDSTALSFLGTQNPSTDFVLLRWDTGASFYLEPFISPHRFEDPTTPASSTLAHEVAFMFRGQWAFDSRLIPQYRQVAGGLYSVRGYNQAETSGDNAFIGTAEYRLHVPQLFGLDPTPPDLPGVGEFRWRPQYVYGRPDWDFVVRVFTDVGRTAYNDPNDTEIDDTLWSIGFGVELSLFRNLSVRLDLGHALRAAGTTPNGGTRGHVAATLIY